MPKLWKEKKYERQIIKIISRQQTQITVDVSCILVFMLLYKKPSLYNMMVT